MNDRRLEYVPLGSLKPAQGNPKMHADQDIHASIGRFGYVEPMVLDERTGRLVAGHGRREALLAMRESKQKPPAGVQQRNEEWLVPVIRGWSSRSDDEASAYLIASNQLTILGGWDDEQLSNLLSELSSRSAIEGIGFAQEAIDLLASQLSPSFDADAMSNQGALDEKKQIECPSCHHKFTK